MHLSEESLSVIENLLRVRKSHELLFGRHFLQASCHGIYFGPVPLQSTFHTLFILLLYRQRPRIVITDLLRKVLGHTERKETIHLLHENGTEKLLLSLDGFLQPGPLLREEFGMRNGIQFIGDLSFERPLVCDKLPLNIPKFSREAVQSRFCGIHLYLSLIFPDFFCRKAPLLFLHFFKLTEHVLHSGKPGQESVQRDFLQIVFKEFFYQPGT